MVKFTVNGKTDTFNGDEEMPLLWYLRDDAKLFLGREMIERCMDCGPGA